MKTSMQRWVDASISQLLNLSPKVQDQHPDAAGGKHSSNSSSQVKSSKEKIVTFLSCCQRWGHHLKIGQWKQIQNMEVRKNYPVFHNLRTFLQLSQVCIQQLQMPKVASCASIMMNTTHWAGIPWVFLLVGAIGPDRMHAATAATSSQISQSWAPACASLHPASLWWGEAPSTQVFFLLSRVTTAACSVMHYEQMASLSLFPPVWKIFPALFL